MENLENIAISTHLVRDFVLSEYISNGTTLSEHLILNTLPIKKVDDKHVISDFTEYLEVDGYLPAIKSGAPKEIVKFINVVLTNVINRHLTMAIPDISMSDFIEDRKSLIELIRDDKEIEQVISKIDFVGMFKHGDNKDDIIDMYDENERVTYLVVKNIIRVLVIPEDASVSNSLLDTDNEILKLTKNLRLYKLIDQTQIDVISDDNEYLIYLTNGKSYLLSKSIYNYPTIKSFDISEYQLLNIK